MVRRDHSITGVCLLGAAMLLGGCASSKPLPHPWSVTASLDHLPLQGLPAVPDVVTDEHPIVLANLESEAERDARRRVETAAGAADGAAFGFLSSVGVLWPLCSVTPALCVGVTVAAGAVGAGLASAVAVAPQDAAELAAVFSEQATNTALQAMTSKRMPAPAQPADGLRVRVLSVVMIPKPEGVTFRLVAQAQALPAGSAEWKPTIHFVTFATRPVGDWLAADARALKSDVGEALSALGASIALAYLPYAQR